MRWQGTFATGEAVEDDEQVKSNWVPALPVPQPPNHKAIHAITTPLVEQLPTNGAIDGGALRAMESGEKSTPLQRNAGAAIVLAAFLVAGLVLAFVLLQAGADDWIGVGAFVLCAVIGGVLVYMQVTRYSPAGVELDKTDKYENIRLAEIDSEERIAMRKIDVLEKALEAIYDHNDKDR